MIITVANYVGLVLVLSGIRLTWLLRSHVDRDRLKELDDISKAFSVFGPSYEILSDKGRKLLTTSYILYGCGAFLPSTIAIVTVFSK